MDLASVLIGVLLGAVGGIGLGVAAVAFDRRRLMRTLIARSTPAELSQLREQLALSARVLSPIPPSRTHGT